MTSLHFGNNIYYYNKNIKNLIIGFLNLFTDFRIRRWNSETNITEQEIKCPIMFGPIERSSYMNSEGKSVNRMIELPLIHISLDSMEKDKERAFAMKTLHIFGQRDGRDIDNLMPYPYNFTITMTIFTKYQEDTMQLIEQIIPLFNYHRVFYIKHPIFPEELTLSNWTSIISYPTFPFTYEYEANDRRGILSSQINFNIEGWLVREQYESYGIIKDIITNYYDYTTQKGLERVRLIGDPSIRDIHITRQGNNIIAVGNIIQGTRFGCIVTEIISQSNVIGKFADENSTFLTNESLKIGSNVIGVCVSSEPYKDQILTEIITSL